MKKIYRAVDWYFDYDMYKFDCHFYLIDDVIIESSFVSLDDWCFYNIRGFWLTPIDVLNSPYFRIYNDDKVVK